MFGWISLLFKDRLLSICGSSFLIIVLLITTSLTDTHSDNKNKLSLCNDFDPYRVPNSYYS